VIGWKTIVH